jgi:uncharacterized membrane protein YdjX (TVP38/TMEM64 family)
MAALRSDPAEAVNRRDDNTDETRLGHASLVRVAVLVVFIAGTVLVSHRFGRTDTFAVLSGWLKTSGFGLPLFPVLFLVLNTVGLPAPVLGAAAGALFGPVSGAAITLVAMMITACAQFLLARHVVGERVRQRLGYAFGRVSHQLERRGVIAIAGARLLPGPFSELNMLAGLTSLKLRDFMIGTLLGCVPKALAWSGIGALLF